MTLKKFLDVLLKFLDFSFKKTHYSKIFNKIIKKCDFSKFIIEI